MLGLALIFAVFGKAVGYPEAPSTSSCFGSSPPGTKDRSDVTIRLAYRNWLSHNLASRVAEIVIKEYLNYNLILVDASTGSTAGWGPDMAALDFDFEMEQWQVKGPSYQEYVKRTAQVMDLGPAGYEGRVGAIISGGQEVLVKDKYADFWRAYTKADDLISLGFPKFGDIDARAKVEGQGETFPICGSDTWCPDSGPTAGYYVPPQCEGIESDPSKCIVMVMVSPGWDSGFFEQLTNNLGLKIVHAYVGTPLFPLLKERMDNGKPTHHYWWEPDPMIERLNAARISFPDYAIGCTAGDTRTPDGPVACDYPVTRITKLAATRLRTQAPEAIYALTKLQIFKSEMLAIMRNHTEAGGQLNAEEAACMFVKSMSLRMAEVAPPCISSPPASPQTGDLVFNPDKMECEQVTVYAKEDYNYTCLDQSDWGTKDRSSTTIRVGYRTWLGQQLSSITAMIFLKEFLRYRVEKVHATGSTAAWGPEISAGLYDLDMEQWQASSTGQRYKQYIVDDKTCTSFGEVGYGGRSGVFMFRYTLDINPYAEYYKLWENGSDLAAAGFYMFGETDNAAFVGADFPVCKTEEYSYCQASGPTRGYWVPPQCQTDPTQCAEVFYVSPGWDQAYFEQLTRNLNLKAVFGYYGWNVYDMIKERYQQGSRGMAFYGWTPDPLMSQLDLVRISYPDNYYGCDRENNLNADTGGLACDYPETAILKIGSARLQNDAPEAYTVLSQLMVLEDDINGMMALHTDGGGDLDNDGAVCEHIKRNLAKFKAYVPDCILNPKEPNEVSIGDTVFDPDAMTCKVMDCPAHQVLMSQGIRVFCQDCTSGLVPNQDRTSCQVCHAGTVVNGNRTACESCLPGRFADLPAMTQCNLCAMGTFGMEHGLTTCSLCEKGTFTDVTGQTDCQTCEEGMAIPRTTDSKGARSASDCKCPAGHFESAGAGPCEVCTEGLKCEFGSAYDSIVGLSTDSSLVIPNVVAGYYTQQADPLSVYLCDIDVGVAGCPGGMPGSCGQGRVGLICQLCPDGKAMQSGECKSCPAGPGVLVWFALPAGLLLLAALLFKVANDTMTVNVSNLSMLAILGGIVVTTFQSIALLPTLSIHWRSEGELFSGFSFLLGRPDGVPLSCALSSDPVVLFAFRCILPLICVLAVCIVWAISRLIAARLGKVGWSRNTAFNTLGQLLQTVFIAIAVLVVSPLKCYGHPNGKSSMSAYPQLLCWDADAHITLIVFGILVGLFFLIPFLTACIMAVRQAPSSPDPKQHYRRWRFLLYRFRPDLWWWGIPFLFRQICLAFSACISADSPFWQIIYFATVTLIYASAVCAYWPWKSSALNLLDFGSILMLNLVIVSAAPLVETAPEQDVHAFVVIHWLLIFLYIAAIFVAFGLVLFSVSKVGIGQGFIFGSLQKQPSAKKVAEDWQKFIHIQKALHPQVTMECISTFNEFDLQTLVRTMASFQSISPHFGEKSCARLIAISHSDKSIEEIADMVADPSNRSLGFRELIV